MVPIVGRLDHQGEVWVGEPKLLGLRYLMLEWGRPRREGEILGVSSALCTLIKLWSLFLFVRLLSPAWVALVVSGGHAKTVSEVGQAGDLQGDLFGM